MSNEVRWGILATGLIAGLFTKDLQRAGHKVVAVGSRSKERADRFAAQFGITNAYGSYEQLFADRDIDIVYVATPHPSHVGNATAALQAGKHVLVEKSFAVNAAQAEEGVDLAEQSGLVALEGMWTRFLPHMLRIREIVRSGNLGAIRSVVVDHTQKLSEDPAHRLNALELGGGALFDLGIYPIFFAWDLLGPPVAIRLFRPWLDSSRQARTRRWPLSYATNRTPISRPHFAFTTTAGRSKRILNLTSAVGACNSRPRRPSD